MGEAYSTFWGHVVKAASTVKGVLAHPFRWPLAGMSLNSLFQRTPVMTSPSGCQRM